MRGVLCKLLKPIENVAAEGGSWAALFPAPFVTSDRLASVPRCYARSVRSSLASALAAQREPSAKRGLLDRRCAAHGVEALADEVEEVLEATRTGYVEARAAALALSSWLVHHHVVGVPETSLVPSRAPLAPSRTILALRASPGAAQRPLLSALLREGRAAATLAKGGRLGEICLPASAIDSAPPSHMFVSESSMSAAESEAFGEVGDRARPPWEPFDDIPRLSLEPIRGPYVGRPPLAIDSARFFYGRGTTGALEPLRMHHRPRVIEKLLDQRWLRLRDVVLIAARRPTVPALAWAIASRDRWFFQAPVREALAQNPFSPTSLVLALLPAVTASTIERLARSMSPEVSDAAKRFGVER